MNRKAAVIAVLLGVLGLLLLALYQRRFEVEASGGEKVKVLTVVKQIDRGKMITEELVAVREIPIAYVEERAIKENEKAKVLGLRVGMTLKAGQTVMWTDLVTATEERRDVSSLVLPGYRALTIRASRDDGSVSLVRPGDYVDVLGVLGTGGVNEKKSSVVLLQRVLVLATGGDTSADSSEKEKKPSDKDNFVTLSVTLTEAQLLTLAAEHGRLAVAVRHPDDQARMQGIGDLNVSSIVDPEKRGAIKGVRTIPTKLEAQ